jgi:hypothetical protein
VATKTTTQPVRDLVREAMAWPSMAELAEDYGVPPRFVRSLIDRGLVETVRLNVLRVNPASFEAFVRSGHTPGIYH